MKRILIIAAIIVVILIAAAAVVSVLAHKQQPQGQQPATAFPGSGAGSTGGVTPNTGGTVTGTRTITAEDGSAITAKDFLNNGTTIQDPQNPDQYWLAGQVGYCNADGTCPGGAPAKDFHVLYFPADNSFIISLVNEPIGQARTEAEQFMAQTLGLTQDQLCSLKYQVLVPSSVNDTFAGQNLGFSFCTGAVKLP